MMETAEHTEMGCTPEGVAVSLLGTATGDAQIVPTGLRPADGPDAHGRLTLICGADVARAVALLEQPDASPSIWVADDAAVEELAGLPPKERPETIASLVAGGCLLARSAEQLRRLAAWAPMKTARMHLWPEDFGAWADRWLSFIDHDTPSVVLHDTDGGLEVPGALVLREDLGTVSPADEQLTAWLPAGENRRDEHGRIEPRLAAWYANTAAAEHRAELLVLDRPEVAVALVRSPNLRVALALAVPTGWYAEALAEDPVTARRIVRNLSAGDCTVLASTREAQDALREQGFSGPLRVLDLHGDAGRAGLRRLAELARPLAELTAPRTLLMAGHDFKFAGELLDLLRGVRGLEIDVDRWPQQNHHSVEDSDAHLQDADIIFCEFASHNAVWYSWHKRPEQRLVVRFHGYELFQDFVHDINLANVDVVVFVSEFYRERVIAELGWPREKTAVVHNMIDAFDLDRPKHPDARFHLGIAGIVPILKRPDRALDLLEALLRTDERYVLHVRGRSPWDYGWMWQDPVVQDAYRAFYERLAQDRRLLGHVAFDAFGADMGGWFRRIGWMLSPSTRETFHLAPVEGSAGGALPVVWRRDGAEEIFDASWVHDTTDDAAAWILRTNETAESFRAASEQAKRSSRRFDMPTAAPQWSEILFGAEPSEAVEQTRPEPESGPQIGSRTGPQIETRFDEAALRRRYEELGTPAALDRLLIGLLGRPETRERALELAEEHQDELPWVSAGTRRELEACRVRRTLRTGDLLRAPRTSGSAYFSRPGFVLVVGPEQPPADEPAASARETAEAAPEAAEDTGRPRLPIGPLGEQPELLAVGSPERGVLERIQIAADAVTRRARVHRPQALCVDRGSVVASWAAVLAGRRLGVPVAGLGDEASDESPPAEEFDALVQEAAQLDRTAVQDLQRRHDRLAAGVEQRRLDEVTVGIISDEFTERTVSERCSVVHIPREDADLAVAAHSLDALFVESAWSGRDGEWFHGVAYYKDSRHDIEQAVRVARAKGVPVIFWNKEDPVHFRSFAPTAALCDAVFTTDADRIPAYLDNDGEGRNRVVASMPFFAEPRLHHPLPGSWPEQRTISYAGTYYGARYADRSTELDKILAAAQEHGLTIYDRQRNHPGSPYSFPERYEASIAGGLSYDEVLEAYKAHPLHINVNSVNDSPTMFSRRVVEIAATGSVVLSGRGRGLQESLPEVPASDDAEVLGRIMGECLHDARAWRRRAWQQLRAVRRSYLGQHALTIMLRAVGLPIATSAARPWTAIVPALDVAVAQDLLRQTHRPSAVLVETSEAAPDAVALLEAAGIDRTDHVATQWAAHWQSGAPQTWAEDMIHAAEFVPEDVTRIGGRTPGATEPGLMTWQEPQLPVVLFRAGRDGGRSISWLMDDPHDVEGMSHDR